MSDHSSRSSQRNLSGLFWIWLLILAGGLLLCRSLFLPGILISGDNPSHLAEIYALRDVILAQQGWWTGWFEGDYAGYPLLTYQYPVGKGLVLLAALLPGVDIPLGYKLLLFFSWLFPLFALTGLLHFRQVSFAVLTAVSLMYLCTFDSLYFSMAGMWNQYLSAGIFLLAGGSMIRLLQAPGPGQAAKTSFWSALAAVSHQFNLLLLPLAWLASLVKAAAQGSPLRIERLRFLLLLPFAAFLLSSWYFYPVLLTWDWPQLPVAQPGWFNPASSLFPLAASDLIRVGDVPSFLNWKILIYSSGMAAALAFGVAGLLRVILHTSKGRQVDPLFQLALGIFTGVSALIGAVLLQPFPFLERMLLAVGAGRLALYVFLSLLAASAFLLQVPPGRKRNRLPTGLFPILLSLLLVTPLLRAIWRPDFPHSEVRLLYEGRQQGYPELAHLHEVWGWLESHSRPEEGRLFCQDTSYNLRESPLFWSHLLAISHRRTGLWTLGAFGRVLFPTDRQTQSEGGLLFGRPISAMTTSELERQLELYNCRYALACEPALTRLLESSGQFEPILRRGSFTLFRSGRQFSWSDWIAGQGTIVEEKVHHHRRTLHVTLTDAQEGLLRIKSAYHPWWTARVDGNDVQPRRSSSDLLLLVPVSGKGKHRVELEFRPPKVVPVLLTLFGGIWCAWLLIKKP